VTPLVRPEPDQQAAAQALLRTAEGTGRNVEMVRPAWVAEESGRLRGEG